MSFAVAKKYTRKIVIQQKTLNADGMGGSTTAWSTFATAYADIEPMSGTKRFFAGKLDSNTTHLITIHYQAGITPQMRVSFTIGAVTRIFQIHSVLNHEERNRYLTLSCQEGVAS